MTVAGFNVQAALNNHPTPTLSFRLEYGDNAILYSSDHEAGDAERDTGLLSLAEDANLWILDAQFTPEQRARKKGYGHSSYEESVELALESGVDTAVLFHHDPAHTDDMLDSMGENAAELAAGTSTEVLMARDGLVIDV